MDDQNQDTRSVTLLEGIKKLKKELQIELVGNVLEIETNFKSSENLNQLVRIERAADQYRKRSNNLFYIGFLGHFSSGKSSTINTLLNLKGTSNEKKTDHNPTDDQITLITSTLHSDDVIKLTRTDQVPVIISLIEGNILLEDKVLMDTPGSGDPSTFEEIVRDSLPLCDLLIYCMAATHPLTNSDIPLLIEKEKHLSDIPTVFLITRANEFKIDPLQSLDSANFNLDAYTTFASGLAARIKVVVPSINIEHHDFTAIDNVERFQIEKLQEKIDFYCNPETYGNILRLHDHKIEYFTRTLKAIKAYFIQLIATKLETIQKYFTKAKVKLEEYEQETLIGSDKMINSWRSVDEKIRQVLDGSIYQNNTVFKTLSTSNNFFDLRTIKDWNKSQLDSNTSLNKLISDNYQTQIKSATIDLKDKIRTTLFHLIDNKSPLSVNAINEDIVLQLNKFHFSNDANYAVSDLHKKINKEVFDFLDVIPYPELKKQIESLKFRTKNNNPLESVAKSITEAKSTLGEIFETYKNGVRIYTVAAFSIEAKSYIKNLGLSDKLDLIDVTEPDINSHLTQTDIDIFSTYNAATRKFENACSSILTKLNDIAYDTPIITTESSIQQLEIEKIAVKQQYDLKFEKLGENNESKLIDFFSDKVQLINYSFAKLEINKDQELKQLKWKRTVYYLYKLVPFALILLFTLSLFNILPKYYSSNNLSIGNQWIFGILVNVASAVLTFIISRKKDKHPLYTKQLESNFITNKKKIVSETIEEDFEEFKTNLATYQRQEVYTLLQLQSNDIIKAILSEKHNSNNISIHSVLIKNQNTLKQLLTEYSEALNEFKNTCSKVLTNSSFNKEIVLKQSKLIKQNSISPSFALLEQTRDDIAKVKTKIEQIDFV